MGASIANDAEKANSTGQVIVSQEVCENKVRQVNRKKIKPLFDSQLTMMVMMYPLRVKRDHMMM